MKHSFDPYRKWLGITPRDQPPHHYRLLGIEPFEADPDVIANAADGRMAQVKNFQIGKYSQQSQRILNEIAAAKVCLLNPEKKAEYDRQLRPRLEAENKGPPQAAPPAVRKPRLKADSTADTAIPAIDTSSVFSYVSTRGRKRRSWQIPLVLGTGAVALVVLAIFLLGRGNGPPVAQQPVSPETQLEDNSPNGLNEPPPADPDQQDSPPAAPEADPKQQPANPPTDPDTTPPADDPGRPLADLLDPLDPGQSGDYGTGEPGPETPGSDQPPEDANAHPKRLPVPDSDARREAEQRIRAIFKREFAAATTPDQKLALAMKLANQAQETTNDPTARFVLMHLACEEAAEAGELTVTLDVADRMRQLYDIKLLAVKAYLLDKVAAAIWAGSATSAMQQQFVEKAMALADEAVAADDFAVAGGLMKLAISTARKMKDPALLRRLTARDREIGRMKARFIAVSKALDVLAENPADGEANLTAGRWYCFSTGNWDKGLPLLAKGADAGLSKLAKQDLAQPEDPKQQMELADQWWSLAKKEKGPEQRGIQARARHWYEMALPDLKGLDKTEVEERLAAMAADTEPKHPRTGGVIQRGNLALASNRTTVTGNVKNPTKMVDGNTVRKQGDQEFTYASCPCEWTITFDKVYLLREVRFLLVDTGTHRYRYALAVSADGRTYTPLVDRSKGEWTGWQQIQFAPRPVKAVKLIGLYASMYSTFYVVEFEAYSIPPPPLRE